MSMLVNAANLFTRAGPCPHVMKRAQRALYGGRMIHDIMATSVKVDVTTYTIRCIDKAGSLDNYLLTTKDKDLASELGVNLKKALKLTLKEKAELIANEGAEEEELAKLRQSFSIQSINTATPQQQ
eukprot:gene4234-4939_t